MQIAMSRVIIGGTILRAWISITSEAFCVVEESQLYMFNHNGIKSQI